MGQSWLSRIGIDLKPQNKENTIENHPLLKVKDDSSMRLSDLTSGMALSTLTHIGGTSHAAMMKLALTCGTLEMLTRNYGGWKQALATDFEMDAGGSGAQAHRMYQFYCQFEWLRGKYVLNRAACESAEDSIHPYQQLEMLEIEFTESGFLVSRWRNGSGSGLLEKEVSFLEGRLAADRNEEALLKIIPSSNLPLPPSTWPVLELYMELTTPATLRQLCDVMKLLTEILRCVAILGLVYTAVLLVIAGIVVVAAYWQMPRLLRLSRQTRRWELSSWVKGRRSLESLLAFDNDFSSLMSKMISEGYLVPLRGGASVNPSLLCPGGTWPKSLPRAGVYEEHGDDPFQIVVKYSSDKIHISPLLRQQRHPLFKENLCVDVSSAMSLTYEEQRSLCFDDYMALEKGLDGNPNQLTSYCPVHLPLGHTRGVNYCRAWYTPSPALPTDHPFRWKLLVVSQDKFLLLLNSNTLLFKRNLDI